MVSTSTSSPTAGATNASSNTSTYSSSPSFSSNTSPTSTPTPTPTSPSASFLNIRWSSVADIYEGLDAGDTIASPQSDNGSITPPNPSDSDFDKPLAHESILYYNEHQVFFEEEGDDRSEYEHDGVAVHGVSVKLRKRKGTVRRPRGGRKVDDYIEL